MEKYMLIEALQDCYLLKDWSKKPIQGRKTEQLEFAAGTILYLKNYQELNFVINPNFALVTLDNNTQWYLNNQDWKLSWQKENGDNPTNEILEGDLIDYEDVDWTDWDDPISAYYRVGNATLEQYARLPLESYQQQNIVKLAKELDAIRVWWGAPLLITSWFNSKDQPKVISSSGLAVVFRPEGDKYKFSSKFIKDIYKNNLWLGSFGMNLDKGYFYLDLSGKEKVWKI